MARAPAPGAGEPRIWSSVVRALLLPLEEMQLSPDALLDRCGIPRAALEKSQEAVPLRKYLQLLDLAAEEAKDPIVGVHLARSAGPETLGSLGFLFLSSRTLLEALSNLCAYVNILQDVTHVELIQRSTEITWCYDLTPISGSDCRHDVEFSIALICRLIRMYAGANFKIDRVTFRHSPAVDRSEYERLIRAPVVFEQDANSIVIRASAGQVRGQNYDHNLSRILQEMLDDQLASHTQDVAFSEQVYTLLYPGKLEGPATARSLAAHFGVSEATLHRRLRSEGVHLSEILDRRHSELAKHYLLQTNLEVTQIAHLVGFSESASFTRAFKRWYGGVTPSAFRKAGGEPVPSSKKARRRGDS